MCDKYADISMKIKKYKRIITLCATGILLLSCQGCLTGKNNIPAVITALGKDPNSFDMEILATGFGHIIIHRHASGQTNGVIEIGK